MTKETYEDGATVTYQYDNNGALATVTDSETGIKTTYYYDFTDRTMKYVESGSGYSHSVGYEYDRRNNMTALAETINGVKHTTSYTYNSDNLPLTTTSGSSQKSNTYDDLDRVVTSTIKHNGTSIISEELYYEGYDSSHTSRIPNTHIISVNGNTVFSGYGYDDNGNISFIESSYGYISYQYDSANQLIREDNEITGKTKTWTYDAAGNIQERKEYPYTLGTLGTPTYTAYYFYEEPFNADFLSIYDNVGIYGYDNLGNPTYAYNYATDEETRYTWKHGRQLATFSDGTTTWTYTYNADGLRTKRTNGTSTYNYVYNGGQLTQMTVGTNTLYISYDASGRPFTLNYNGAVYYYVLNMLGDVVGIANSAGTLVVRYWYDAWGYAEICSGTMANTLGTLNPLRYRSYVYDQETGLYYLQSRYYNPERGRFLNADAFVSTGQGFVGNNMFAYCLNNPVNFVDNLGTTPESILAWWSGGMWWLCAIDTYLPAGDALYYIGVALLSFTVMVTNTGSSPVDTMPEIKYDSTGSSSTNQSTSNTAGGAASPRPPKKDKNPLSYSKEFRADTVYNKKGIRIDYEYNGNGTGNVHMHMKGQKFHYDSQGFFKIGPGNSAQAPYSIQKILYEAAILKAILKAIKMIEGLGGTLI